MRSFETRVVNSPNDPNSGKRSSFSFFFFFVVKTFFFFFQGKKPFVDYKGSNFIQELKDVPKMQSEKIGSSTNKTTDKDLLCETSE